MEQIILDTLMKKKLSHVDNRYEYRLSDSILVRADVGEYGPYVRIKQHDMWIVLSVKAYKFPVPANGSNQQGAHCKDKLWNHIRRHERPPCVLCEWVTHCYV